MFPHSRDGGGLLCLYILNPRYIVQYICATLIAPPRRSPVCRGQAGEGRTGWENAASYACLSKAGRRAYMGKAAIPGHTRDEKENGKTT